MKKMMVLYRRPADVEAFLNYYEDTHLPIVRQIPSLQKAVVNRVTADVFGGEPALFMIAELHFSNDADFDAAMKSEQNMAAGRDLANFAKGLATVLIVDESTLSVGDAE